MIQTEPETDGSTAWTLAGNTAYDSLQDVDVSVVISLYNYAEYIGECLESLAESIRFDPSLAIEVIVVDDASTDGGDALVSASSDANPDIPLLLVQKQHNAGLSQARNLALRLSRGKAAFILDADNTVKPPCLSTLYRHLSRTGAAAVYGCIEKFSADDGGAIGTVSDQPYDLDRLLVCNYIDAMAMFSITALFQIGLYDDKMIHGWEDYDVWLSLGFKGMRVENLDETLSSYRVHTDSMLSRLTEHVLDVGRYLYQKHQPTPQQISGKDVLFGSSLSDLSLQVGYGSQHTSATDADRESQMRPNL